MKELLRHLAYPTSHLTCRNPKWCKISSIRCRDSLGLHVLAGCKGQGLGFRVLKGVIILSGNYPKL